MTIGDAVVLRHTPGAPDPLRRAHFGDMGGRFTHDTWHAELDGEVVGTATIGPPRDIFGPWVGELHHLAVRASHRRRGIGDRLHETCLAAWRARGITVAVLQLPTTATTTRDFYESRGWRQDGHTHESRTGTTYTRMRRPIT